MLYTYNITEGLFDLEVKLSILLVPLFVLTSNIINKYNVYGIIKTFVLGVSLSLVLQYFIAGINFFEFGNTEVFFYSLLSYFHHPSYLSMYTNFAIAAILVRMFHSRDKLQWRHFLLLGFFVVSVYQLSSRAGFLTLIVLLVYAFVYIIFPILKWRKLLVALVGTLLLSVAIVYPIAKYTNAIRVVDVSTSKSSSGVRLAMWQSSISVMKDNFLFGVGTGDANRELQQNFAEDKIIRAVRDNLNAHNQYIQTQVALGVLGTFLLLWGLLFPAWVSIKKGRVMMPLFALILLVNFLTESMLNTQAGVIYLALLNSVVFFTYED
ncbi:MAG: O-antigen ligase [Salibacteraceae bacterium]|jgi:O-antigen ligase